MKIVCYPAGDLNENFLCIMGHNINDKRNDGGDCDDERGKGALGYVDGVH